MTRRPKILIVEDEIPLATIMTLLLARADCEVKTATTSEQALQMAQEGDYDLITLDVDLPGINGLEVFSRLKKKLSFRNTPIIFVSERAHKEDQRRGLEIGAADYITKPFNTLDFAPRILSHLTPKASTACTGSEAPIES
jgi:DNA-binding response OmpR family regulator